MDKRLVEILRNNKKALEIFKDQRIFESIRAVKEIFMEKILERGDIRLLILDALASEPKHGYQIMKSISQKFLGFYEPSPGVIYPTLQSMGEEGLLGLEEGNGKKTYSLTKKGKEYLKRNRKRLDEIFSHVEAGFFGKDKEYSKRMEEILDIWTQMAYEVYFRSKKSMDGKGSGVNKKMDYIEGILKKTLKELKAVWK